jgi:hypothetical protein
VEDVERQLPNGFHDGKLRGVAVDFAAATLTLDVDFWIGELGTDGVETRAATLRWLADAHSRQ